MRKIGQNDYEKRLQFARSFNEIFQQDGKNCSQLMTNGAHFDLNGFVNKQNFRYWGVENQRILNEKELHPQRVTVRFAIMCHRIIGRYFVENAKCFTETVDGERYQHILNTFLRSVVIHLRNRHELWFQQDESNCHTADETIWMCSRVITSSPAELLSPAHQDFRT